LLERRHDDVAAVGGQDDIRFAADNDVGGVADIALMKQLVLRPEGQAFAGEGQQLELRGLDLDRKSVV
jgi:hypothetical protein